MSGNSASAFKTQIRHEVIVKFGFFLQCLSREERKELSRIIAEMLVDTEKEASP